MQENIFEIKDIVVQYQLKKFNLSAVNHVNLNIKRGKITALVGESGSGKTTLATAILNCISTPGKITNGEVLYLGKEEVIDVAKLDYEELNKFRWQEVSMVFQGAQSSLNPLMTIYEHFLETYKAHNPKVKKKEMKEIVRKKAVELLTFVNLDPERVLVMYPHELSGGMKQRVMIAFSLLLEPKLIILDEPTTALDVIVQNYIFKLLKKINREMGISMLLLTHDIGVVAQFADYVAVMYGGEVVEYGTVFDVFTQRLSPYTNGLIKATPSLITNIDDMDSIPGTPPDIRNLPKGCVFNPRCSKCMEVCLNRPAAVKDMGNDHFVKCHLYEGDSNE